MSSWVKVSRKLLTSAIAAKPEYLAVWMHLILSASYKQGEILVGHQVVVLQPGQLVFGRVKFSAQIGVSEQVLRSALKALEKLGQITIKSTSKYSIISITNWSKYQGEQPANNQQLTSKQPAVNHNKEVQELQEEKPCDQQAESPAKDPVQFSKIMGIYNEVCGGILPAAIKLDKKRQGNIRKCWNMKIEGDHPFQSGDFWKQYFKDCLLNPHWTGNNDTRWRADIEFLTREANVLKVLEAA